jgi:hypothetical protein
MTNGDNESITFIHGEYTFINFMILLNSRKMVMKRIFKLLFCVNLMICALSCSLEALTLEDEDGSSVSSSTLVRSGPHVSLQPIGDERLRAYRLFLNLTDSLVMGLLRLTVASIPNYLKKICITIVSYLDRTPSTAWQNEKQNADREGRRPVPGRGWKKSYITDMMISGRLRRGQNTQDLYTEM